MENTLENKAKFFAQYYGQKILIWNEDISKNLIKPKLNILIDYVDTTDILELKPLSSISDDDAEYCIGKVECNMRKNDPNHGDYGMSPSAIFVNSLIGDNSYHIGRREADYLRSKGYALKWMDKTVKEQLSDGWIKIKK